MDLGSSKHSIGSELTRGVESRMFEYTKIEPPMGIRVAEGNMLHGTAHGILPVVVRGIDDELREGQFARSISAWFEEESIFQFSRSSKRC